MKRFNTIDDIYELGVLRDGEYYVCSVCDKRYKKKENIDRHIEPKNCFKYYHVFKNTPTEELFYKWYSLYAGLSGSVGYSKVKFRRTPQYSGLVKFYNFCMDHKISDMSDYFKFIINEFKFEKLNSALLHGTSDIMFKRYRRNIGKYIDKNKSEIFLDQNKKKLRRDTVFCIRALERGDISYLTLFDEINFDEFVIKLSPLEKTRLETFLENA